MNRKAEKALKVYQSCVTQFGRASKMVVTRRDLNTLYNVLCRMRRDEEYKALLEDIPTVDGKSFEDRIEAFFSEYNNLYGLEIRDSLIEFDDPEYAAGSYFRIKTYLKSEKGEILELAPTDFKKGQTAYVTASLFSHESGAPVIVKELLLTAVTDEGTKLEKRKANTSSIDFEITLSSPGYIKFNVKALAEDDAEILGSEMACGGIVFSREEIKTFHEPPRNLYDFWNSEISRLIATDPCDKNAASYSGDVKTLYDIHTKNRFSLIKLDASYLQMLRENGQPSPSEQDLLKYDIYELMLKCPGPCPSTGYVSIPKNTAEKSLPIFISYDGYSVRNLAPVMKEDCIAVHCSHHGYELGYKENYYAELRQTVCGNYCRGNGEINSCFDNIRDCYSLYVMLRDLQMIRYLADKELSRGIEGLHRVWNGEIVLWGSSMGGYQSLSVGGLMSILKKYTFVGDKLTINAGSPAFADVAAGLGSRVKSSMFTYSDGADYFDTANLSTLIDSKTSIFRASLGDDICTATSMTAIYNMIPEGVEKEIRYVQNSSHGYLPDDEHQEWFVYNNVYYC